MSASLLFFYLSICLSYLFIRPMATVVHELGHLLYLRILCKQKDVNVYIGSLGEGKRAFRFQIGSVLWIIHPSCLLMRGSLCDFKRPLENRQIIPFALAGPSFSLGMTAVAGSLAVYDFSAGPAIWTKIILILAALIPMIDVFLAMFYKIDPVLISAESMAGSDGQMIAWRLQYGKQTAAALHGNWLFDKERYAEAEVVFTKILANGCKQKEAFEYLIFCKMMQNKPEEAIDLHLQMSALHRSDPYDLCRYALALAETGKADTGWEVLQAALRVTPGHEEALNLRAFWRIGRGELHAAMEDLDQCIRTHRDFATAYCNRGWISLLKAEPEKALPDLTTAMRHEHENPYLHRNWAVYYLLVGNVAAAGSALESARLLGLEDVEHRIWQEKIVGSMASETLD